MLELHPKVIAHKNSIAKLKGCNSYKTKVIWLTQRILLPFKVKHQISTNTLDPLFFGEKFVPYTDGSIWLHIELLQHNQDVYVADEDDPKLVRTKTKSKITWGYVYIIPLASKFNIVPYFIGYPI